MIIGVIPARLKSKRLPEKILVDLNGKPLIVHTVDRVSQSKRLDKVILAIDSKRVQRALQEYDFNIVMTSSSHQSGTDRVAEVAKSIPEAEIVINIQGDEPLIDPLVIDSLINSFDKNSVNIATVLSTKLNVRDLLNPNVVKTFVDEKMNVSDFKRNIYDMEIGGVYRHVGIYGFRKKCLFQFTTLEQSKREIDTNLEQLRALDNNMHIHAVISDYDSISVDVIEDLEKVSNVLKIHNNQAENYEKK